MSIPEEIRWRPIGEPIGQGGQGKVHRVEDAKGEHQGRFALKEISNLEKSGALKRFHREIEAIQRLSQISIIKIIDCSNPGDSYQFYVMEFCPNAQNLDELIRNECVPYKHDAAAALAFFQELLEAIKSYADAGIVHRDLAPQNILVLDHDNPHKRCIKLIDFGICHFDDGEPITLTDEAVGTRYYMAPECDRGSTDNVDIRADLYSAGKLLWSVITGLLAFDREERVFKDHSLTNLLPDIPASWHLIELFEKTIRKDPSQRFRSAEEAIMETKRVADAVSAQSPPLDLIYEICPLCRLGDLSEDEANRDFGLTTSDGRRAKKFECNRCGYIFFGRPEVKDKELERKRNLV